MVQLTDILKHISENIWELKWEHKFNNIGSLGQFYTNVVIDKKKYEVAIFGTLQPERDCIYVTVCRKNPWYAIFSLEESGIYDISNGDELWKVTDFIFTRLQFRHAKELSFFFAEQESNVHKKTIDFLREIEDKD